MALRRRPQRENHLADGGLDRRERLRECHQERRSEVRLRRRLARSAAALASRPCCGRPGRTPTGSSSARTCRSPSGCSAGRPRLVLVVSFVALAALWPQPRLEGATRWRPLPGVSARCSAAGRWRSSAARSAWRCCGLVIVAGFAGPPTALENLAPMFVFITFWVGLVFASVLFGDVFRAFNPWRAIGRATGWALRGRAGPPPVPGAAGPLARGGRAARLRVDRARVGLERAAASRWSRPRSATRVAHARRAGDLRRRAVDRAAARAFSVYFNLFSRLSIFETRDRVVGLRPPLAGLPRWSRLPGHRRASCCVMIGTVTFDGLSQGPLWKNLAGRPGRRGRQPRRRRRPRRRRSSAPSGCCSASALVAGFYWLGIEGARSVGGEHDAPSACGAASSTRSCRSRAVYVAAHYFTFLLFEGQAIALPGVRPASARAGTCSARLLGDRLRLLSQTGAWYVAGRVRGRRPRRALVLAHDRALALYANPRWRCARSTGCSA